MLAGYVDDEGDFSDLGRDLGRELVEGDETIWSVLQSQLVEEQSGSTSTPIDAVVVATTWTAAEPDGDGEGAEETQATASLMEGLVSGLDSAGVPIVGVAGTDDPAAVLEAYRGPGHLQRGRHRRLRRAPRARASPRRGRPGPLRLR